MIGAIVSFIIGAVVLLWLAQFSLLVVGMLIFGALLSVGELWAYVLAGILAVTVIAISAQD
jgi:hypothetical protein